MTANHTPTWAELDTYEADFLNETPPRREEVTEIQARENGMLLCYADPERAALIVEACNSHAANLARIAELETALSDLLRDFRGFDDKPWCGTSMANARAALAKG